MPTPRHRSQIYFIVREKVSSIFLLGEDLVIDLEHLASGSKLNGLRGVQSTCAQAECSNA